MKAYQEKEKEKERYKIKVNKKSQNNKVSNSIFYLNNSKQKINYTYNNKNSDLTAPNSNKSTKNYTNNILVYTPFHNKYISTIPPQKFTNSDERDIKYKKIYKNMNMEYYNYSNNKDSFNAKSQKKSVLDSEHLDEKLLNFRPNSDLINSSNNINCYNESINNEKMESSKRRKLFINTKYINDFDFIDNNNNYRTIGHNNINNYINELQLINNYYDVEKNQQNKPNNFNFQSYNNNAIISSAKRNNKEKYYNSYNQLLNYSSERHSNKDMIKFNNTYCIRSKIFSKKNIKDKKDIFMSEIDKKKNNNNTNKTVKTNKTNKTNTIIKCNITKNYIEKKNNNKDIILKSKSQYSNDGSKIKNNKINFQYNKYNYYNRTLFDKYRGKLIQEFDRHLQKVINNHLLYYGLFLINSLKELRTLNNNLYENQNSLINSSNRSFLKKKKYQKFIKINYSDKKYPLEKDLVFTQNNSLMSYSTLDRIKKVKLNNNINIRKNKINNKILNNHRLFKHFHKSNILYNYKNRKSVNLNNNKQPSSNNIKIIDINYNSSKYIYNKKMIKVNKYNTFMNKSNNNNNIIFASNQQKEELNNISSLRGKIIDIDINLGKPVNDINEMSNSRDFSVNNYKKKAYKCNSLSMNITEKHKRRHKKVKRILSLPKKKYLEEGNDFITVNNDDEELFFRTNSYDHKKSYKKSQFSNLNNNMTIGLENKKYKNILVKKIVTSDKLLFIHINYLCFYDTNTTVIQFHKKMPYINLTIEKNNSYSIYGKGYVIKHYKKSINNKLFDSHYYSRNYFSNIHKRLDKIDRTNYTKNKYLLNCIKFLIKTINKIFLKKAYNYYRKSLENRSFGKGLVYNNEIKAYKKKANKGKNFKIK